MRIQEFGQQNTHVILLLHGGGMSWRNDRETVFTENKKKAFALGEQMISGTWE